MMLRAVMLFSLLMGLLAGPAHVAQGAEERVCVPGQAVTLVGVAPAASGLLVRFGGRVVAGAGTLADGRYTIELSLGPEAPGRYPVAVELRGTGQVVQALTCVVPGAGEAAMVAALNPTPTAVPPAPPALPAAPPPADDASTPAGEDAPGAPAGAATVTARPAPQRQVQGQAPRGWAELSADAPLLLAVPPQGAGDVVTSYRRGTRVRLLGQSYLRWVQVQPAEGVTVGWMDAASLTLLSATPGPEPTGAPADKPSDAPTPEAPDMAPTAPTTGALTPTASLTRTSGQPQALAVELLVPSPIPAPAPAPVARTVRVSVCRTRSAAAATCAAPLGGARVELLLAATDELLASATTGADGAATMAVSVPAGAALLLRLPALGVAGMLAERDQAVTVALPPSLVLNGGQP